MGKSVIKTRNQKWVAKMQNQPNMKWLDLTQDSKDVRLKKLLTAILEQYTLTYPMLQEMLLCSRSWVTQHILCEVPHIFVNIRTLAALKEYGKKEGILPAGYLFPTSYYFFDAIAFEKWLRVNTIADRQTRVVDLSEYSPKSNFISKSITLYNAYTNAGGITKKEKYKKYDDFIFSSLDEQGQSLYVNKITSYVKRTEKRIPEPIISLPSKFVSSSTLTDSFVNNERVSRQIYKTGSARYTIKNSLVRFSADEVFREIKPYEIILPASY